MRLFFGWKRLWYLYSLLIVIFSFYLYMKFVRFLLKIEYGPIVQENISEFRLYINYFITFIFFCYFIIFLRIIYKLYTNNIKNSYFYIKIKEQIIKIKDFIIDLKYNNNIYNINPHSEFLILLFLCYNRFLSYTMRRNYVLTCKIMFILIFCY